MEIRLPKKYRGRRSKEKEAVYYGELEQFADAILERDRSIAFKVSSRGWCYLLEGFKLIDKSQFDYTQDLINECRKIGLLPIRFVLEDSARCFDGVEMGETRSYEEYLGDTLDCIKKIQKYYDVSFWEGQDVYIEGLVEKIDLKTLFAPVMDVFHVARANARGWYDISMRAEMAERFKYWELKGKQPILIYCGDFDPTGLQISEKLLKNFWDISGGTDWLPTRLKIDRFGLNYDLIQEANLTWIDNLTSGSGKPPNKKLRHMREYIEKYGERKVEANALVIRPDLAERLVRDTIQKYLPPNAIEKYKKKEEEVHGEIKELMDKIGLESNIDELIRKLEGQRDE